MAGATNADLSTAQLSERTGLTAGTLRMWETRHGFPEPTRSPGGHRRYSPGDVEAVREVLRLRGQGLSLSAAIHRARRHRRAAAGSVFAGLRERRADVPPVTLLKPVVAALTRAIEDEYCARAANGVLVGSFQHERHYRAAERRWRELARTAELAVALADFPRPQRAAGGPVEVPIDRDDPLAREWAVVFSAGDVQACLAAWEQLSPAAVPDAERRSEVVWSFDPAVVADALDVACELLRGLDPETAERVRALRDRRAAAGSERSLQYGGALAQRMVGYLGRMLDEPAGT